MRIAHLGRKTAFALSIFLYAAVPVLASPWAEVGDNQLRSDIALLAAAGVLDDVTTHWPLPWNAIVAQLGKESLFDRPLTVREAAERVMARAHAQNQPGLTGSVYLDATNRPSVVYGFDGMGRSDGSAQFSLDYNSQDTAGRLSLGGLTQTFQGKTTKLMPEGTYLAEKLDNAMVYGGYLSHWWGPGWISALSLSNNARPMPQIGIERLDTSASKSPWLSWLGPWQLEFFLGYLDGPRIQKDTFYNGLRLSFQPIEGLEIGLARTEEFCGQGHPCAPIRDYFDLNNDPKHVDKTNDEGLIDIKYSRSLGGIPFEVYMQLMNEDTSPFTHSGTSHLFGSTLFLPAGPSPLRLTLEYTDSVPTADIFSFGDVFHGFAYTNGTYPDGMRYRDRTLGFSLDSDSRLLSLQGSWSDEAGRFYELSLHHAVIGNPNAPGANIVSTAPVIVNMGEARITLPLRGFKFDLAERLQDDQPRPHRGFLASTEAAITVDF
ncbi:MAG TPA: capsule assembly Wzi family protein [Rhizomicrobium sp.]|jgi:hypothetical protein|nr:capsule assembly Wzi family protein [Rhizomicrobium sp.]